MKDIYNLCERDKDIILSFLLYHMSMPLRMRLAEEHPVQYNRLCGQQVVTVRGPTDFVPVSFLSELLPGQVCRILRPSCPSTSEYVYLGSSVSSPPDDKVTREAYRFVRHDSSGEHVIHVHTTAGVKVEDVTIEVAKP